MSEAYKGKAPRTEELGPGRELAKWRGRRVFVWDDRTDWPGMEAAIVAAFKAADNESVTAKATPLSGLCRDVAALLGELVPRLPAKWHVYEVVPLTFSLDQRPFHMAFVHKDKRELFGHPEGAYLDLATWDWGIPETVARSGGNVPLATWRGRKIYIPRVGKGWPTHKKDILAALQAAGPDANVSEQNETAETASDPTAGSSEDIELDKRRAWIAPVNSKDDVPPGLLIGGLFSGSDTPPEVRYRLTRNSPQWKNPVVLLELLGRLPGEYSSNDRFEVVRYHRRGNRLVLTYRRGKPDPEKPSSPASVYLYAPLLENLKPGEYTAEAVGADPKQKLPRLDYSFKVPTSPSEENGDAVIAEEPDDSTAADGEVERLLAALIVKSVHERRLAAYALGELGDRRGVKPLIAALTDEDELVRDVQNGPARQPPEHLQFRVAELVVRQAPAPDLPASAFHGNGSPRLDRS